MGATGVTTLYVRCGASLGDSPGARAGDAGVHPLAPGESYGWRDRRYGDGSWSSRYDEWVRVLSLSTSGVRLGRTVRFTASSQSPTSGGRSPLQPDEFQGLVATARGVALTWSQLGSDGLDHLMFRRIPLSAWS